MIADQKEMNVHQTHSLKNNIKSNEIHGTYILLNTPYDSLENFVKYSILKSNELEHVENIKQKYRDVTYFTIQWYISELNICISKKMLKDYYLLTGEFTNEDIEFVKNIMGEEATTVLKEIAESYHDLLTYNVVLYDIFFKDRK